MSCGFVDDMALLFCWSKHIPLCQQDLSNNNFLTWKEYMKNIHQHSCLDVHAHVYTIT
jgi:hypothetical protein